MGKRILWEHSDQELDRLFEEEAWSKLIEYSEDNRDLLISEYLKNEKEDLAASVKTGAFYFNRTENRLKRNGKDYALFSMGKVKGVIEILGRILGHEARVKTAENIAGKNLSGIKHLDEIVLKLDQNKVLTHSGLASQLNDMRPSTLTENMKKISAHGLIYTTQVGKYKHYSLSDAGARYAAAIKKKRGTSGDIAALKITLEELLQDRRARTQTMDMMRQLLKTAEEKTQEAVSVEDWTFPERKNKGKISSDLGNAVLQHKGLHYRRRFKGDYSNWNNFHRYDDREEVEYGEA